MSDASEQCDCMAEDPGDGGGERVLIHSSTCHLNPEWEEGQMAAGNGGTDAAGRQAPCPSWHFLPGPYQGDEERQGCPLASTHAAQRRAWAAAASQDPLCAECGWEQSHTRHHDPKLYNFHPFAQVGDDT